MKNFSKILALPIVAIGGSTLFINSVNAALSQSVIDKICSYNEKVREFDIDENGNSFVLFAKTEYDTYYKQDFIRNNFLVKNGEKVGKDYFSPSNAHPDLTWPTFPFYEIQDGKLYDGDTGPMPTLLYIDGMEAVHDPNTMPKDKSIGHIPEVSFNHEIENGKLYKLTKNDQGDVISKTLLKDLGNNINIASGDYGITEISPNNDVVYWHENKIHRNNEIINTENNIRTYTTKNADVYVIFAEWDKVRIEKNGQFFARYDIKVSREDSNMEEIQFFIDKDGDNYIYFGGTFLDFSWKRVQKWVEGIYKNGKPLCEKVATPHPLEEKITKLPAVNDVTLADEAKISEIKKEFDRLSEEDKKKIPAEKVKKLADLEVKIVELKKKKEDGEKNNSGNNSNNSSTSSSSSGSGGGGYVATTVTTIKPEIPKLENTKTENTKTETPKTENSTKLFPKFVAKKSQAITDLRDAKLADLNKRFGIVDEKTRNEALSRGEFLRIVLDSANANLSGVNTEKLTFADVGKNTEIAKYIAFARENNIISGYSDNTFRTNATISRAEATKILMESLNVKIAEKNTTFADVTAENTLGKYIQTAYDNYILSGTSKTTFEPNRSISRGELIKIIYNILN